MSPDPISKNTQLCPTCGTRLTEDAVRCLVCGTELTGNDKADKPGKSAVQGSRMPEITLSLPLVMILMVVFLAVGAGLVYYAMRQTPSDAPPRPLHPRKP